MDDDGIGHELTELFTQSIAGPDGSGLSPSMSSGFGSGLLTFPQDSNTLDDRFLSGGGGPDTFMGSGVGGVGGETGNLTFGGGAVDLSTQLFDRPTRMPSPPVSGSAVQPSVPPGAMRSAFLETLVNRAAQRPMPQVTPASASLNAPYYQGGGHKRGGSGSGDGNRKREAPLENEVGDKRQARNSQRLARKAALARQSRQRKKEYVQGLESRVQMLSDRIEQLERQHVKLTSTNGDEELSAIEKERVSKQKSIEARIARILEAKETPDSSAELSRLLDEHLRNSRERQSRVDYYVNHVKESLTPGLQVKFAIWALTQDESFYKKKDELFYNLVHRELDLSPNQIERLMAERAKIANERKNILDCDRVLEKLRVSIKNHLQDSNESLDRLRTKLTPHQLARFSLFTRRNKWSMRMMESIYDRT